jgi:hypothetical protein
MHVNDLLGEAVTLSFKGMDVTFLPSAYTFADQEGLASLSEKDPTGWRKLREMLGRILVSWDLEDEQGPIPCTAQGMERVPIVLIEPLMEALGEALRPSEDEKKDLSAASSMPSSDSSEREQESPNGMDSSPQPDTSASLPGISPVSQSAG